MSSSLKLPRLKAVSGRVKLPGSKSLSNRALLLAALSEGTTRLDNLLLSDDTEAMLEALSQLGVRLELDRAHESAVVHGLNGAFKADTELLLDLHNAGTAMRPLCAALAVSEGSFVLTGTARMQERPIGELVTALKGLGLNFGYLKAEGFPPLKIEGSVPSCHQTAVNGATSSQFVTALLLIGPVIGGLELTIEGNLISKPYVDLTIALMEKFGAKVERDGYRRFSVSGRYVSPGSYLIEGDATGASYFIAAAANAGELEIYGLGADSTQGDIHFAGVMEQMGAVVRRGRDTITVSRAPVLHGIDIDMNDMPDAAMTLVPMALYTDSPVTITNIASWRVKETDRIDAMCAEMKKLGVKVESGPDWIRIDGSVRNEAVPAFDTYKDHRMAMSMALCSFDRPVVINDPACVNKTFPEYFTLLDAIGEKA